ncbi:MAG: hypothetical protein ABI868_06580 [Acidobacteriota bacterium]
MTRPIRLDARTGAFIGVCAAAAVLAVGYIAWSRSGMSRSTAFPATGVVVDAAALTRAQGAPHLLFRNTDLGEAHGRVLLTAFAQPGLIRLPTPITCERIAFTAGRGVCLAAERGTSRLNTSYYARTLDAGFTATHSLPLPGIPSRVRLSPSGRLAGITVFVSGDSYASNSFSTRAMILDVTTGEQTGELEEFTVLRDGAAFKAADFNFWGMTFADDQRLYATLQTNGRRYLIEADLPGRTARIVADDVECPALSPDGRRIAFKKRETVGGNLVFRVSVLDLASRVVTELAETRSADDQPEWLDDERVAYALASSTRPGSTDIWVVAADGSGAASRLIEGGWSPAVVH